MEGTLDAGNNQCIEKDAPHLAVVLKEMKDGLDLVRNKAKDLTSKVKRGQFPTENGISYLEAKHLILLNYCQSLVYYMLRKAKGLSVEGHPVIHSLVELRLFLEKIRPIDKKLEYQIQKLMTASKQAAQAGPVEERHADEEAEDLLKYHPNPDRLQSKFSDRPEEGGGVYRPPKIAPTVMEEDGTGKRDRNALRKDKDILRQSRQGYVKEMLDDLEGRPQEVRENVLMDSREYSKYESKWEKRARQEEELFTRVSLSKAEKKKQKHLMKSRNGLLDLADEIKALPMEESINEKTTYSAKSRHGIEKPKKRCKRVA